MQNSNNEPDIIVYSDGSGYLDGTAGWAVCAMTPDRWIVLHRQALLLGSTVDRSEMAAMLEGMHMAVDIISHLPEFFGAPPWHRKPIVQLYSDRESMVNSIKGINGRNSSPDLWAQFAYFESILAIRATHVYRDADFADFVACDLEASTMRNMAVSYLPCMTGKSWSSDKPYGTEKRLPAEGDLPEAAG